MYRRAFCTEGAFIIEGTGCLTVLSKLCAMLTYTILSSFFIPYSRKFLLESNSPAALVLQNYFILTETVKVTV